MKVGEGGGGRGEDKKVAVLIFSSNAKISKMLKTSLKLFVSSSNDLQKKWKYFV